MPNWVVNKVTISGDEKSIEKLLAKCKTEESEFSFDGIIRMPNDVDWYSWSIEHWGTKWDACDADVHRVNDGTVSIVFDTAWSAPIPIYKAINKKYRTLDVHVEYADEDLGENCGIYDNGTISTPEHPFRFACEMWGYGKSDIKEMYEISMAEVNKRWNA